MLPSLESLRCFLAAARLLNFRAAARSVALTSTALGQRIQKLEGDLGVELFLRSTRTVSLTEAGLALLPAAQRCLDAASECVRAARGDAAPRLVPPRLPRRRSRAVRLREAGSELDRRAARVIRAESA